MGGFSSWHIMQHKLNQKVLGKKHTSSRAAWTVTVVVAGGLEDPPLITVHSMLLAQDPAADLPNSFWNLCCFCFSCAIMVPLSVFFWSSEGCEQHVLVGIPWKAWPFAPHRLSQSSCPCSCQPSPGAGPAAPLHRVHDAQGVASGLLLFPEGERSLWSHLCNSYMPMAPEDCILKGTRS